MLPTSSRVASAQPVPEILHYKFDQSGTSVTNNASAPPAGTATGTINGDTTLANAMGFLIDSNQKEVRGLSFDPKAPAADPLADLGFSFRLYKGKDSMGWYSDEQGADEYSVANLYLDIAPVRISRPLYAPWSPR